MSFLLHSYVCDSNIIITMIMFMMLSLWEFNWLGLWVCWPVGCYCPHPPSPFVVVTQPECCCSFYHCPMEGWRLSWCRNCSKGVQLYITVAVMNVPRWDSNLGPVTPQLGGLPLDHYDCSHDRLFTDLIMVTLCKGGRPLYFCPVISIFLPSSFFFFLT